ncbi:MAG: ATP-binding protein [Verrucomicrobiota bacterium]
MRPLSFRLKIALLSAGISGLVLVGFGLASGYFLYRQKLQSVDTELRALGSRHPGWLANRANFERFSASLQFVFGEEHEGTIIFLVKDAKGETLYVSPGWPKTIAAASVDCALEDDRAAVGAEASDQSGPSWHGGGKGRGGGGRGYGPGRGGAQVVFNKVPRFLTVRTPGDSWRLGIMGNNDLRLVVGLNYDTVASELGRMRNIFLVTLPAALLLVGGGGWWVAGRALRPLKIIAQTAEHVTARGLEQRIPASAEDPEISRLIQILNGMMDRLEASFKQANRFSADASHELKTPLAIMQGELENALQTVEPGSPPQQVFSNLLEETQRLKTITRGLLLLAQADGGQLKLAAGAVDLSALLEAAIEDARILAADASLRFDVNLPPGLRVEADRALLQMAILNLLGNAVKYSEAGGSVSVTLAADGSQLLLTLCNSGLGIPPADQPRVFDRFYRVNRSPATDGLGLGLSLAREIVHAHHGQLLLKESRPGCTCFMLSLPSLA